MTADSKRALGAACLLAAIGALYLIGSAANREAASFFRATLAREGIQRTVLVAETPYRVQDGGVSRASGAPASEGQTLQALRVAYAVTVAERSPLFGLAGSDPVEVEEYAIVLKEVTGEIAALQETETAADAVKRALYPTAFLAALADAERARRDFIRTPSETLRTEYDSSLRTALAAYEMDLRAFIRALTSTADGKVGYEVMSGTITKQSFLAAAERALERVGAVRQIHDDRESCVRGEVQRCSPADLALPELILSEIVRPSPLELSIAEELLSIYKEVLSEEVPFDGVVIALYDGVCVPDAPDPQLYLFRKEKGGKEPHLGGYLWYASDFFSYETEPPVRLLEEGQVSPLTVLQDAEVLFTHYKPTAYYLCPQLGAEISRARATQAAYAVLDIPIAMHVGGYPVLDEMTARSRASEAMEELSSRTESDRKRYEEILEIVAMFSSNSGALELMVREIALNQRSSILQYEAGFFPNMSAQWQFLTKSGFSSLYLLHHKAMGLSSIDIFSGRNRGPEDMDLLPWSELRDMLPREKIVRDLKVFFLTHTDPQRAAEI